MKKVALFVLIISSLLSDEITIYNEETGENTYIYTSPTYNNRTQVYISDDNGNEANYEIYTSGSQYNNNDDQEQLFDHENLYDE